MRREGSTPEQLLAGLSGWHHEKVARLRELVRTAAPELEETVRSGILYYEDRGDVLAIGAQKHHVSLYVLVPQVMDDHRDELAALDCGKGCIRFKARTEIPDQTIAQILSEAAASPERDCDKH